MSSAQELPEPLAQGDLSRTPFAHVLLYVEQQRLSGTLVVWKPDQAEGRPKQDRIRFDAGVPVAGRLIETASRLERGLLPLFGRTSGPYAFYAGVDLVGAGDAVREGQVEILPLITASLRGSSRDDMVAHVVGAFGDSKLRFVRGADLGKFGLLPEEQTTLELLRAEPVSAQRLSEMSQLQPRMVLRLLYLLALTKSIEPWDEAEAPARRAEAPAKSKAPPTAAGEKKAAKRGGQKKGEAEPPPPPPADLSPAHKKQWEEIAARAVAIESENYFDMLGVARDVSAAAVQKAYFGLVKKWHPDRLPKELAEIRPTVEQIFQYLTRAQETLMNDAERGKYLSTVQEGGGTPEADRKLAQIVGAAMEFRKVEVLMRRRDWAEAIQLIDDCLAVAPDDPDYHATKGWVLYQMGEESTRFEMMAALDKAIELSPKHDKAHFYKGMILKKENKHREALEHLRKAAELNPKNIEAVREVRIAEMRGDSGGDGKETKDGGGSFFGKLFGGKKK